MNILLITPVASVQAQTKIQNEYQTELSSATYHLQSDPFLIEWTLGIRQGETEEDQETERVLARWREKQANKWLALPKDKFVVNASAYTAASDECGKSDGVTSSGLQVAEYRTLACPPSFPFGTKIYIEGVGERRCEDRGGSIKGNHVDIYMKTKGEAFAFGRKNLEAYVVE